MKYDGVNCPKCGKGIEVVEPLQSTNSLTGFQEVKCSNASCGARFNEAWEIVCLEEVDRDGHVLKRYPTV